MSENTTLSPASAVIRLRNLIKKTTAVDDVHPRDDFAFGKALNIFVGKLQPDQLDDDTRPAYEALRAHAGDINEEDLSTSGQRCYHALRALQHVLTELDEIMALPDIPPVVLNYLEQQVARVRNEAERYNEEPSLAFRVSSVFLLSGALGWLDWIAIKGQDKSFMPLRMPTNIRTTLVFFNWVQHPTANYKQLLDIAVQRLIVPSPGQILYTISIFIHHLYGTDLYKQVNIFSALGLVTLIIVLQEAHLARDKFTRRQGRRAIRLASSENVRNKMQASAAALNLVQDWMMEIREGHKLSPAEDDQFSRFQSEVSELVKGLRSFADLAASPGTNEKVKDKLSTIIPTVIFGIIQAIASYRNPAGLALIASQLEYTIYRQFKIAMVKDYTAERAWNFMGQSGGIVPAMVGLQSIPLLVGGPDIFSESIGWFYGSTISLSIIQCTLVHKTGPGVLVLVQGLGRIINQYCCCLKPTDNGIAIDVEAFAALEPRMRTIEEEETSAGRSAMTLDRALNIWGTAGIMNPDANEGSPAKAEDRISEIEGDRYLTAADELKEMFDAFLPDEYDSEDEEDTRVFAAGRPYDFGEIVVLVKAKQETEN
jgi:hypothetical protein